jgi:prolyl oligopeptidase
MKRLLCYVLCLYSSSSFGQWHYPLSKTVDSSDTYFGVSYKDPYRWLEHIKQPGVITWFKQQATYTDSILNRLNGRDELIAEWKRLDELEPALIYGLDKDVTYADLAGQLAFLLWQCGDPGFQMRK